jgi:hypothetical protein
MIPDQPISRKRARSTIKWLTYLLFFCVPLATILNITDIFVPLHKLFKPQAFPAERQDEKGGDVLPDAKANEVVIIPIDIDYQRETVPAPHQYQYQHQYQSDSKSKSNDDDDDAFFPVDSGGTPNSKKYWPLVADEHWNSMPRVFHPRNSTVSWCNPNTSDDYHSNATPGLILVKVHKAASSTLAGVNLRISHHITARLEESLPSGSTNGTFPSICQARQAHEDSRKYRNRDPTRSFLYSSIRDPVQRAMSWIFYTMSNQGVRPTDEAVLQRLKRRAHFVKGGQESNSQFTNEAGAQVGYMHTGDHLLAPLWNGTTPNKVRNLKLAKTRVAEVLQQYDFIVIVERIQESLVVLQLLLGLKTTDILYLSSKLSGGFSFVFSPNPGCHKLTKAPISPAVDAYLSSSHWYAQNYQDYLLYKAANQSLDLTIDNLGRTRFNKALAVYQQMMHKAKDCENEAIFPCSSDGVHQEEDETNCYQKDWGCGYPCLDRRFGLE